MTYKMINHYVHMISDNVLRNEVKRLFRMVPDYFPVVPAAKNKTHHADWARQENGLIKHTEMVCRVALDLLDNETFLGNTDQNKDLALTAALFHDSVKLGWNPKTVKDGELQGAAWEHPLLAGDFILKNLQHPSAKIIAGAIKSHMGRWNYRPGSPTLPKPSTAFEKLIMNADYIASRTYIDFFDIGEEIRKQEEKEKQGGKKAKNDSNWR